MFNDLHPTPEAVAAGLMEPDDGVEPRLTAAGLFALSAQLAYAEDIDDETRQNCMGKTLRMLIAAKAGGLDPEWELIVLRYFAEGFRPVDGTEAGEMLATVCRLVAMHIPPGGIIQIFKG